MTCSHGSTVGLRTLLDGAGPGCYAARLFQIIYPENVEAVSGVSHTAIVENKRLGHGLTIAKAQQDFERETKVMTNSEKTG